MTSLGVFAVGLVVVLSDTCAAWWRACRYGNKARSLHKHEPRVTVAHTPFVSVLIPAWHEPDTIRRCLQTLRQVTYPCWEIIVIASRDDATYEVAGSVAACQQDPRVTVIEQMAGGKNVALNQGSALARGDVITILDADCVVGPDWLFAMLQPLLRGAAASCGNYFPLRCTWVSRAEQMEKFAYYSIDRFCSLGSGSIAIRREALEAIGGFPRDVYVGVDWDLNVRLAERGMQRGFAEDAVVWTDRPATLRESWNQEVRWRRAHMLTLWRHRNWFLTGISGSLRNTRFYLLTAAIGAAVCVAAVTLLIGWREGFQWLVSIVALLILLLAGRRTALAGKVASYTGDWRWSRLAWAPAVRLPVECGASLWALLTLNRATPHFKGPRTSR
jgi:cellulose synthase/poly-beta-1,6-N-acetylglucosamine synthase-like glycosyltransferase